MRFSASVLFVALVTASFCWFAAPASATDAQMLKVLKVWVPRVGKQTDAWNAAWTARRYAVAIKAAKHAMPLAEKGQAASATQNPSGANGRRAQPLIKAYWIAELKEIGDEELAATSGLAGNTTAATANLNKAVRDGNRALALLQKVGKLLNS
jgi:hypothetical protein